MKKNFGNGDFRWLPYLVLIAYFSILVFSEIYLGSYSVISNDYFFVSSIPYFWDLGVVLCGIDAMRNGLDPYLICTNYYYPDFNYPISWGMFSVFPFVTTSNHNAIGLAMIFLSFLLLYFFIGKLDLRGGLYYALFFVSTSTMLAFDRGNCDVIILIFLLFALVFRSSSQFLPLTIALCAILKIFPIGGFLFFFKKKTIESWKSAIFPAMIMLATISVFFLMRESLFIVSARTPRPFTGASYGLGNIPSLLIQYFKLNSPLSTGVWLMYYVGLVIGYILTFRYFNSRRLIPEIPEKWEGDAFLVGSGIFITTCLIGFNFNYRFIFLVLTIPFLLSHLKEHKNKMVLLLLVLSLLVSWHTFIEDFLRVVIGPHLQYKPQYNSYVYQYVTQGYVIIIFWIHLCILQKRLLELWFFLFQKTQFER